jgi:hypothetical protein
MAGYLGPIMGSTLLVFWDFRVGQDGVNTIAALVSSKCPNANSVSNQQFVVEGQQHEIVFIVPTKDVC